MKAERPDSAQESTNRDKRHAKSGARPKRNGPAGSPLGFGSVLRDVRKPGDPIDAGLQAAMAMGAVLTGEQLADAAAFGIEDAVDVLAKQDRSATHIAQRESAIPTMLGKMSPSKALETVVDEATRLAITEANKELHVELEPAHLGPLIVRLKREPDGRLDIRFRAKQADATRVLDAGSELLRERLAEAGFHGANVVVEQDEHLVLAGQLG